MKREEAQQLLELCRPGHPEDLMDPALAEARAMLEEDAELKAWFEAQQAIDAEIADSLNALEVPADLKASILAGMRLHQTHAAPPESETSIPFPDAAAQSQSAEAQSPVWWRSPWTGIAALFLVMMVIFNLPDGRQANQLAVNAGLPPVIQFLSDQLDSPGSWTFDKQDNRTDQLQTFLASQHVPSPQTIPDCLGKMTSIGCVTFEYENTKLSMICFNGEVYHLITADKATYPDALPTEPRIFEIKDKAYRLWVDGEQVKILTVHGTKEDIPEFI